MIRGILLAAVAAMRLTAIVQNFDGRAGLVALDLDNGQRVILNADQAFPMASVCKLPVAIALLQRIDRGEVSLADRVTLGPDDFHAGHSPIADEAKGQPITVTVERLLTAMVRDSDNSAVDYVLAHYVPPKEVMKALRGIHVRNVDISRPEGMIIGQILNEGDAVVTRAHYATRVKEISMAETARGLKQYWQDWRDTATPNGMIDLLAKLYRHEVGLKPESEALLTKLLTNDAGPDRIRAGIPTGAALIHKTGTMPGTLNDVGIITSVDGKHHIAMAVFTKWSQGTEIDRAKVVAALAKAAYDGLTQ